jgi:hypothetical protein
MITVTNCGNTCNNICFVRYFTLHTVWVRNLSSEFFITWMMLDEDIRLALAFPGSDSDVYMLERVRVYNFLIAHLPISQMGTDLAVDIVCRHQRSRLES